MINPISAADNQEKLQAILNRNQFEFSKVNRTVTTILNTVKAQGDQALYRYTEQFDHVKLNTLKVTPQAIVAAKSRIGKDLLQALKNAAENITRFHQQQKPLSTLNTTQGVTVGQRFNAIEKVGLYIPGGSAAYPSSVLMNAIPAKIAGVKRIIMVTPPLKDGTVKDSILVAADLSGVDEIYTIGGAQAIAALTYGTQTIPSVDKIVGPGNIYVAIAKRLVSGYVGIDMIAGPSEIAIIADETSNPKTIAADMLSQAEHDAYAASIVLISDATKAGQIKTELTTQTLNQPRKDIIQQSLKNFGAIIITKNTEESIRLSNSIAPEHLEIMTKNPDDIIPLITNAGAIFIGEYTPEPLGDYYAGPNHTLPTSGSAKFSSALSTTDFMKSTSIIKYTQDALKKASKDVILLALEEGLFAHADAIKIRLQQEVNNGQ